MSELDNLNTEMLALLQRAFDAGRKAGDEAAVARILRAAQAEHPQAAPATRKTAPAVGVQPKPEYGANKSAIRKVLRAESGVTSAQLPLLVKQQHGLDLTIDQVRNALKVMARNGEIKSIDGKWFPKDSS